MTALLGGHIDAQFATAGSVLQQVRNGEIRILGIMDKDESKFLPGVKTMDAQGYRLLASASRGISVPAGTPKEVADVLSGAVKRAMESEEVKTRTEEIGLTLRYMDAAQFAIYWDEFGAQVQPLVEQTRIKGKN